jgi:2-polyprenyl-6-methoxyphenol hydroxylase-like FAD-dependent oxidoreductase
MIRGGHPRIFRFHIFGRKKSPGKWDPDMAGRAVIVGGGIGGLTAALALRRVGWNPVVFERAPELREVGAGITLWSNAVKVLRQLGVAEKVEELATPLRKSEVRRWDGKLLTDLDLGQLSDRAGAPTIGVHRADLQRALADAVGPESLTLGAPCVGFRQDANGIFVRLSDGREEKGDLLIGADGLRSVVRSQLLGPEKPRYAGYTAWRGVAVADRPEVPTGATLLALGRGSQVGYLPIGGGRTYWFATANVPEGWTDTASRTKSVLVEFFADWYPPIPGVIAATEESAILRNDIHDRPPVRTWGTGRVTLLGDAAHPTTPNLGQGGCMAIEDAPVLARCLAEATDIPAALREYERLRYERTAMVTRASWRLGKLFALEGLLSCWLRDTAIAAFPAMAARRTERLIDYEP